MPKVMAGALIRSVYSAFAASFVAYCGHSVTLVATTRDVQDVWKLQTTQCINVEASLLLDKLWHLQKHDVRFVSNSWTSCYNHCVCGWVCRLHGEELSCTLSLQSSFCSECSSITSSHFHISSKYNCNGSTTGSASDSRSEGRGFDSH